MTLLNKIKNEARLENFMNFFRKRKKIIKLVALVLAVLLVLFTIFDFYCKSEQKKYSAIFHQAMIDEEKGDAAASLQKLDAIYNARFAPSGVRALASLRYAGILTNGGNHVKALEIYTDIAKTARYDAYLRDLAALMAAKLIAINTDATQDKTKLEADLALLDRLESKAKLLKSYVSEQKAIFLLKTGDAKKAYESAKAVSENAEAAPSLKERASDLMKLAVANGAESK